MSDASQSDSSNQVPVNSLIPLLGDRWAWGWRELLAVIAVSVCWLLLSYLRLGPGEYWSALATVDHFPLMQGVPGHGQFPATAGLLRLVNSHWGVEGLASLFATLGTLSLIILGAVCYRIHQRLLLAASSVVVIACCWSLFGNALHETIFGVMAYAVLLFVLASPREELSGTRTLMDVLTVAAVFCLWSNSGTSFSIGLAVMLGSLLSEAFGAKQRLESGSSLWSDCGLRRSVYLFEGAIAGTFVNPRGIDALLDADFLDRIVTPYASRDWQTILLPTPAGVMLAMILLVALWLFRHSQGKLNTAIIPGWILLVGLAWIDQAALIWLIPMSIVLFQPLISERLDDCCGELQPKPPRAPEELTAKDFRLTLISLLVVWLALTFSPTGSRLLGGSARAEQAILSNRLPVGLVSHWETQRPVGQVVHPAHWGDWLASEAPDDVRLYLSIADRDRCPVTIYNDQVTMLFASEGWEELTNRYRVNTIVLDRVVHEDAEKRFDKADGWRKTFEDDTSVMYQRVVTRSEAKP